MDRFKIFATNKNDGNSFPTDLRKVVSTNGDPDSANSLRELYRPQPFNLSEPLDYRFERIRGFAMIQLRSYDVDNFLSAVTAAELEEVVQSDDRVRLDRALYRFKDAASARRMGDLIADYLQSIGSKATVSIES